MKTVFQKCKQKITIAATFFTIALISFTFRKHTGGGIRNKKKGSVSITLNTPPCSYDMSFIKTYALPWLATAAALAAMAAASPR